MGLNFKLDVGTLRLDQQVACQRYRQHFLDANTSLKEKLASIRNFKVALKQSDLVLAA